MNHGDGVVDLCQIYASRMVVSPPTMCLGRQGDRGVRAYIVFSPRIVVDVGLGLQTLNPLIMSNVGLRLQTLSPLRMNHQLNVLMKVLVIDNTTTSSEA